MQMLQDALKPEQLKMMRKLLEGENKMVPNAVPIREKRDFEEEADRAAFEKRKKARV
jgi:hypothetical protein